MDEKNPKPPAAGKHLFDYFLWLDSTRGSNGWSPNPLDFLQLDAFQRVTGVLLKDWEIRTLFAMDRTKRGLIKPAIAVDPDKVLIDRPVTPELFDALFQ